jgi:hypothetical protein
LKFERKLDCNISTLEDYLQLVESERWNDLPVSPAIACASIVFPVPAAPGKPPSNARGVRTESSIVHIVKADF